MNRLCVIAFAVILSALRHDTADGQSIDSLKAVIANAKIDTTYINNLAVISQSYRGKDEAQFLYYNRLIMQHADVHPKRAARIYLSVALYHSDRNQYDSAEYYFAKAKSIVDLHPGDGSLKSVYHNGAGLLAKRQGNFQEALKHYQIVGSLGESVLGKDNLAGNMLNIANVYNQMANRRVAIRYLFDALEIFESIGNEKGMSYCYNSLGLALFHTEDFPRSKTFLLKSLAMKEKAGDKKGIAVTCNELSLVCMNLKEYDRASAYIERVLTLTEEAGLKELYITALIHKGKVLRMQQRFKEASEVLNRARPLAEQLPTRAAISTLESEIGKVYAELKSHDDAIAQLVSSVNNASRSSNIEAHLNALLFLSEAYYKNGHYKEAFDVLRQFNALEDSARGTALRLDYKELETRYNVEKKDAEIALLRKDNEIMIQTEQRRQAVQTLVAIALVSTIVIAALLINHFRVVSRTRRLLELERVRNAIARDLHDDIGSAMSSIQILSSVALRQSGDNNNRDTHLKKIADQSASIMERMSDIVWSINPGNDSLQVVTSRMKEFTSEILEPANIQYVFDGLPDAGVVLGLEVKRHLFLMYKEILNNIAKHSGASMVNISLKQDGGFLRLHVTDNGCGFDPEDPKRGNGLRNIVERSKAMNATCSLDSSPGKGVTVDVNIPLT